MVLEMLAIYIQVLASEVHWQIQLISVATTQHNSGRPNVLLFIFKYWLVKSIGRFTLSQLQPHNTTVVGPMCYCLYSSIG